ncbi:MAG: hypothetical protein ACLR0U_22080 [Enterocloster clostridioformis]
MDEVRKERLMVAGIDVNGTLERFMGNEALLEQMLNKFKDDTHFQKLLEAAKQLNGDGEAFIFPYAQRDVRQPGDDGTL